MCAGWLRCHDRPVHTPHMNTTTISAEELQVGHELHRAGSSFCVTFVQVRKYRVLVVAEGKHGETEFDIDRAKTVTITDSKGA